MKILSQLAFLLIINFSLSAASKNNFNPLYTPHPFHYDLGIEVLPTAQNEANVMICCHGMGSSNKLGHILRTYPEIKDHIVSFNFPDHGIVDNAYDANQTSFGSIEELLPMLYVLKKCVVEGKIESVNLYGFSAGGGAVINAIGTLNTSYYDSDLSRIGIKTEDKRRILTAIQRGRVILDCPLKSIEEIIAYRGSSLHMQTLADRYRKSGMRPIDALQKLANLKLDVVIHFQTPDKILSNRDDELFVKNLKDVNRDGNTTFVSGKDGGHNAYHRSLWKALAGK